MNMILLTDEDFIASDRVRVTGSRRDHILSVLKSKPGDQLRVGRLSGKIGRGIVVETGETVVLDVSLTEPPPKPLPLTLIMPMVRPLMFKRLVFHAVTLGIKTIILLNFSRVEKSLWRSSALDPAAMHDQVVLGLEQAVDTQPPEILVRDRFKPFVEDELPDLIKGRMALIAHPGGKSCPSSIQKPVTLVIGPEGGLIPYEIEHLTGLGFHAVDLGPRILRVETALPFIIGRLNF